MSLLNGTYLRLELTRLRRDPVLLLICLVLPVSFYLGFTAIAPAGVGGPDLRAEVMVGMACYGAATAASTLSGQAALERVHGWARQLALTPLPTPAYLLTKIVVSLLTALVAVGITFAVAAVTGLRLGPAGWLLALLVVVLGSITWTLYGLTVGLAFRSESALAASAAGLVLLAFAGGVFVPLPADIIPFARWSPMFGYVELGRIAAGVRPVDGLLVALLNWVVWTALLAVGAGRLVARSRSRR